MIKLRDIITLHFFLLGLGSISIYGFFSYGNLAAVIIIFCNLYIIFFKEESKLEFGTFNINKRYLLFLFLNCFLLFLIVISWTSNISIRTLLSHLLAFFGIFSLAVLLPRIDAISIFKGLFLSCFIIVLLDMVSIITQSPANQHGDVLGLGYGGIGVKTSFGSHGMMLIWGLISVYAIHKLTPVNHIKKVATFLLILAGLTALICSQSRSTYFAGFASFFVLSLLNYSFSKRVKPTVCCFLLFLTTMIGIGVSYYLYNYLLDVRMQTMDNRIFSYIHAIQVTMENPLRGIGWEVWYPEYDPNYVLHNAPLNYFVSMGLPGGITYILILLLGFSSYVSGLKHIELRKNRCVLHLYFAMFITAFIEMNLYKSTPNYFTLVSIILLQTVNMPKYKIKNYPKIIPYGAK